MLSTLIDNWSSFYADHSALRTAVEFVHIGGLVAAGGCAVAADRSTLLASRETDESRLGRLQMLHGTHRIVLWGLALVTASGVLMFGADVDTFLYSRVFWLKMGLLAMLLVNGSLILRAERRVEQGDGAGWAPLRRTAAASLILWSLTTLAGSALPNIG